MSSIKLGAGTTIDITIPLPDVIATYENVYFALYTNATTPVKFSYVQKAGFNKLNQGISNTQLIGKLTAAQTAKMRGELYMEMRVLDETIPDENIGSSIPTLVGINIVDNVLKNT